MKKLNPPNNNSLAEIESSYPMEYEGVYSDGYYGSSNQSGEKKLLFGLFSTLMNHWFLILSLTLLITGATIIYVAQKPDYYKSEARVQVNAENVPAGGGRNGNNPIIVQNSGNDPAYFTTQLQILEGSGLLRRVAKSLDLENNRNFRNPQQGKNLTVWQNVQKMFGFYRLPAPTPTPTVSNLIKNNELNLNESDKLNSEEETERLAPIVSMLKKGLIVEPVKDTRTSNKETRLIDVSFTHQDPLIAAKVANAIGDIYVLQNLEQKIQSNASASDFLNKRVADLQSAIRQGEERLINYSKNNQVVTPDTNQNTVVQRYADLNTKLGQAENDLISAQTSLQAARQNQLRATSDQMKDSQVIALENKLTELNQKLSQLLTEYTEEWDEVKQTRQQIKNVENQLALLRKRASDVQIASFEERYNEAVARVRELRSEFNKQRDEVIRQNEASINYRIIQQEIDTNKTLLNTLLQRTREYEVILSDTPNNVMVIDKALVPGSPVGPERTKTVLLAFIISFGVGCGLAFLIDWLDDSVHTSDEIEKDLGLPLLASIPAAPSSLSERLRPKRLSFGRPKTSPKNYSNLSFFDKPAFLEAYLQLRTQLLLTNNGKQPKTVLVTSSEESEGKTLTALNLAVNLSKTNRRVLLIDADLRCPRVHIVREMLNDRGLTTLLAISEIDKEFLENTVQKDNSSSLHILTAGEKSINPANLLSSEEMRKLLAFLETHYDHIIIDSPPVLYFADSTILSTLTDGVILVARDSFTSKHSFIKARKMLLSVGAKIIGMVLNGIPRHWSNYNKYDYYEMQTEVLPEGEYQVLKLK